MKKALAAVVLGSMPVAAMAADLPSRVIAGAVAPVPNWTGVYAGANAGYVFGTQRNDITATDPASQIGITGGFISPYVFNRNSGFTGGGQLGYNYQFSQGSSFVIGAETDLGYTGLQSTGNTFGIRGGDTIFHSRTNYLGTLRARFGYAFDDIFLYGTAGLAYGGLAASTAYATPTGRLTFFGTQNSTQIGYAVGAGVEFAVQSNVFSAWIPSNAITVKAEFIHYDLGTSNYTMTTITAGASPFSNRVRAEGNLARVGVNYKFDFAQAPTPVVARY